jgi:hypothetical protein
MGKVFFIITLVLLMLLFLFAGWYFAFSFENKMMGKYDLYNCIYNNAESNNFNKNPIIIQKIQDECICFREHNYTNLLEVNCSK